jgi:leukotriene-A4 hydrolase
MGNLVTCSTWESFWLNEGFTVFVERKIEQRLYGKPYAQLKAIIGRKSLLTAVNAYGCAHAHTCLHLPLDTKTDPDDAYSTIAYEKGFNLLCHLEQLMGGEAVMDQYLKAHVKQFAHKSLNSAEWVTFFVDYCRQNGVDMTAIDALDWNAWLHTPGMPKEFQFDTSLADNSNALAQKWSAALQNGSFDAFAATDLNGWKSPQTVVFLEGLEDVQTAFFANNGTKEAFRALLLKMDGLYNLTTVQNAEIRFHWQLVHTFQYSLWLLFVNLFSLVVQLCLRSEWDMIYPHVVAFATGQGRMKFTRPLYKELNKVAPALAQATFAANKQNYHSICAKMVARDLGM